MSLVSLTALINSLLPEPQAGLLAGILFGVKATIDTDLYNSLIASGTLHIIALSGMNISILVTLVSLVLLRFVRRPIANLATIFIIIGFIWLVGVSPSVIRAAIMGTISLLAISFGRQMWPLFIWILAVSCMILLNPPWIGDLSFQLSAMATLGIILFGSKKTPEDIASNEFVPISHLGYLSHLGNLKKTLWSLTEDDLRVTLAAQLFTIPIIMFQFGRISLISPLSNILIGWTIAPVMVLGLVMVIAALIWTPVATAIAWITWVPLTFVIIVIEWTAKLPFSSIAW
jgi:competence protein ComEC